MKNERKSFSRTLRLALVYAVSIGLSTFMALSQGQPESPNPPTLPQVTPDPAYPATIQTVKEVCAAAVGNACTGGDSDGAGPGDGLSDYQETGNGTGLNSALQAAIANQATWGNTGAIEIRIDAADFNRITGTPITRAGASFEMTSFCNGVEGTAQVQTRGIIIRTTDPTHLPANPTTSSVTRIKLATQQQYMPAVQATGANIPVFRIARKFGTGSGTTALACNLRFMGVDIQKGDDTGGTIVEIGDAYVETNSCVPQTDCGRQNTAAKIPYGIWIDRSFIGCQTSTFDCTEGLAFHAKGGIVGSVITGVHDDAGGDENAIWINNTTGPILVRNNEISSSGESVLVGGAPVPNTGEQYNPSDMTFVENTIHMDPACPGSWTCKNIFELKTGVRVLIEGNLLYYSRVDNQNGQAFNVKSANSGNGNTWAWTRDVWMRFNEIQDLEGECIGVQAWNGLNQSNLTRLVWFTDNLCDGASNGIQAIGPAGQLGSGCYGQAWCIGDDGKVQDFKYDHNTVVASTRTFTAGGAGGFVLIDSNVPSGGNDRCLIRSAAHSNVLPLQRDGATGTTGPNSICKIAGVRDDRKGWSGNILTPSLDTTSWQGNLLTNATADACNSGTGTPLHNKQWSFHEVTNGCVTTQGSQYTAFSSANIGTGANDYTLAAATPGKGTAWDASARTASGLSTDVGADIAMVKSKTCIARNGGDPSLCSGQPAPIVTSSTPATGSYLGGTLITNLAGQNFQNGATVSIGGVACTSVVFVSSVELECTTGAHAAGVVDIVVQNPDLQSGTCSGCFTYTGSGAPTVTAIDPASGTVAGGTTVTITGTNFGAGASVTVVGLPCISVQVLNSTTLTCNTSTATVPATGNVVVTNTDAQSGTLTNGFTYTPSITPVPARPGDLAPTLTLNCPAYARASLACSMSKLSDDYGVSEVLVELSGVVVERFVPGPAQPTRWEWSLNVVGMNRGPIEIRVTARDDAGQLGVVSKSVTLY